MIKIVKVLFRLMCSFGYGIITFIGTLIQNSNDVSEKAKQKIIEDFIFSLHNYKEFHAIVNDIKCPVYADNNDVIGSKYYTSVLQEALSNHLKNN